MNSVLIAANILKRLGKKATVVVFLIVFPLMAAILGMLTSSPASTALNIGIVIDDVTLPVYSSFSSLKEYNVIKLNNVDVNSTLENSSVELVIKSTTDSFKYEIVSTHGGSKVDILKNQLLYFNEHNEVYTTYKQNNNSSIAAIGIYLLFMIMFVGSSATIIFDDRVNKTYMRLFCFSTSTFGIILGYVLALLIMGVAQISVFIFLIEVVFKVNLAVNIGLLFLLLVAFLISLIGLVIALSSVINSKDKYSVLIPILGLFTTFLSGSIIPTSVLGKPFIYIANFIPQSYVTKGLEILTKGTPSIKGFATNIGILLLFSFVFFSFGTKLTDKESL